MRVSDNTARAVIAVPIKMKQPLVGVETVLLSHGFQVCEIRQFQFETYGPMGFGHYIACDERHYWWLPGEWECRTEPTKAYPRFHLLVRPELQTCFCFDAQKRHYVRLRISLHYDERPHVVSSCPEDVQRCVTLVEELESQYPIPAVIAGQFGSRST